MRSSRDTIAAGREAGLHEHRCWSFDGHAALRRPAIEFIADGLARELRVEYVGAAGVAQLRGDLAGLPDLDGVITRGALRLTPLHEVYGPDEIVAPARQVSAYAAATETAVADGFAGYRAVADATTLVRTPAQRDAFCRYEHLVDRYMAAHPFSAMCAYDRAVLGDAAIAEIGCLHPSCAGIAPPFRLFAGADGLVLSGEVDLACAALFATALERTGGDHDGAGEVDVDASGLEFIDHRGMLELDRQARRRRVTFVLRRANSLLADLARLLGVRAVRVEAAA